MSWWLNLFVSETTSWSEPVLVRGNEARVNGTASTLSEPHGSDPGWFSGPGTLILGDSHIAADETREYHEAEWKLTLDEKQLKKATGAYLVIACQRQFGGLHSRRYGAIARIYFNAHQRDTIGLKSIPDDHSDYFHRMKLAERVEITPPFSHCNTVYFWFIDDGLLGPDKVQSIRVMIDPETSWDIDIVGLIVQLKHRRLRKWFLGFLVALAGAIIAKAVDLLFGLGF